MSSAQRRAAQSRLAAAVQNVHLPTLPATVFDHQPQPAQTRQNLPQSATAPPAQNEATFPSPTRTLLNRLLAAATSPDERARFLPCNDPLEPAQTCHNLPEPAETCHTEIAPVQNEPRTITTHLTPRQRHAATLLVGGHTVKSVAAHLGVNPHTVSEWKKRPAFQHELQRLLELVRSSNARVLRLPEGSHS